MTPEAATLAVRDSINARWEEIHILCWVELAAVGTWEIHVRKKVEMPKVDAVYLKGSWRVERRSMRDKRAAHLRAWAKGIAEMLVNGILERERNVRGEATDG